MRAPAEMQGEEHRKVRVPPGEARPLLLEAARELFSSSGYAGASTRQIARRAGVSEPMLFRIFGSKAALFEKAVFEPFGQFVSDFMGSWEERGVESFSENELAREYIQGLYELLREHRELLMAILSAAAYENGFVESHAAARSPISEIHDRLQALVKKVCDQLGYEDLDPPVFSRVIFGTIAGVAALDDWLFPTGASISHDRVLDEVLALALCRLTKARTPRVRRTASPSSGAPNGRRRKS